MSAETPTLEEAQPATLRLFFALWPDTAIAGHLGGIAREIAAIHGGRPTRLETIHLTLAFLGEVPAQRLDELKYLASEIQAAPFRLVLDRLDHWRHNHLVWAGVSGVPPELTELIGSLLGRLEQAGFSVDHGKRAFTPHVTLVRRVPDRQPLTLPEISPLEWSCGEFRLVLSRLAATGSVYEKLGRYSLGNSPASGVSTVC